MYCFSISYDFLIPTWSALVLETVVAGAGSSTVELFLQESSVMFGTVTLSFTLVNISKDFVKTSFIDSTGTELFSNQVKK